MENCQKNMVIFTNTNIIKENSAFWAGFISLKSNKIKDIMEGKPVLIINKGKICYREMIKQRYTMDDLLQLPGVGRKTANLICGDIYGKPAIIADTHCIRLSNRLGLVDSKNPEIVERKLKEIIPAEKQTKFCHNLVHHGRAICDARKPLCSQCTLNTLCPYFKKSNG